MSAAPSTDSELYYTLQEIRDYLPGGWALSEPDDAGAWDADADCWRVSVRDIADVEWQLEIEAKTAAKEGHIEALTSAIDRLFRSALGKKSFFG